jgi:hypothetical protein
LLTQGRYPDPHTDVEVSSGDDDAPKMDTSPTKQKEHVGDDAEGVSLDDSIAPGPISSNTSDQAELFVADRVASGAPSTGGHKRKHPPPVPKHKQTKSSTCQVMTQIELPLYRGPRSPLDSVAIEIIFGCLFEVF